MERAVERSMPSVSVAPSTSRPFAAALTNARHELDQRNTPPARELSTERHTQGNAGFGRARSDDDRDDRRKIILALIKQKPALSVKDITKSIPTVSEKTIQRELLAMVLAGILIKRGERRWSTYSLRES